MDFNPALFLSILCYLTCVSTFQFRFHSVKAIFGQKQRFFQNFLSTTDFKTGLLIDIDGSPSEILEFMHVKPGKGAAFVRTKVKNLITGNVLDKTFRAGETFPDAPVKKVHAKFSYAENSICSFLADESFEEYRVPEDKLKEWMHFFVVGFPCVLSYYHDQFISLHPPNTFEYTVVGMDGKTAVLDSGAKIAVPPFVAVGDVVQVQIQPLQYMSRSERREEK